jgi:hypothetical protein
VGVLKNEMPTLAAIIFFEMSPPPLFQKFLMILAGYQREKQRKEIQKTFLCFIKAQGCTGFTLQCKVTYPL